jgi:hypothetical protein
MNFNAPSGVAQAAAAHRYGDPEMVLHHEQYDAAAADAHIPVYDGRLPEYNGRHGLPGAWVDRVLSRLAGPQSMAGRDTLRATLVRRGLTSA